MSDEERPEWLPEGWIMRAGRREEGRIERYYTFPSSGYTCHSKAEVMHYMDIEKNDGQATRLTSCFGDSKLQMVKQLDGQVTRSTSCFVDNKQQLAVEIGDSPAWLPSGWIVEIKARRSGATAGLKYKCYFDPFTGSRFYSKREVFRYLGSGELCSPINNRKRSIKTNSTEAICISSSQRGSIDNKSTDHVLPQIEYSSDGLPHGWIKEIKVRKTKNHEVRRDPYYVDPVSGYVFRSRKAVFHYIETGEISKYAFMPKKRHMSNMYSLEKEGPPPIAATRQISQGSSVRRSLFSGQVSYLNVKMVTENDKLSGKTDLPLHNHPSVQGKEGADSKCVTPSNVEHLQKGIGNQPNPACHGVGSFPLVSGKTLNETSIDPSEKRELDMLNEKASMMGELESMKHLQTGNGELPVPGNDLSEERQSEHMSSTLSQPVTKKSCRGRKKRRGRKKCGNEDQGGSEKHVSVVQLRPRRAKAFKAITMPVRSSKRLAGIEAGPGISDLSRRAMAKKSEQLQAKLGQVCDQSAGSHHTSGELKATPITSLQFLEKLEGMELPGQQAPPGEQVGARNLSDDSPGSPLILPFGDSWPDPCIEFAFKTLTGDIPVLEDTAAIEDFFQQQLFSVQSPSLSSSNSLTFSSPVNFGQPELDAQHKREGSSLWTTDYSLEGKRAAIGSEERRLDH